MRTINSNLRIVSTAVVVSLVGVGCAGAGSDVSGQKSELLEAYVFGTEDFVASLATDYLLSCTANNGIELPLGGSLIREVDPAPGVEGEERAKLIGSGLVEIRRLSNETDGEDFEEPSLTDAQAEVLYDGPIATPSGVSFDGGCEQWAFEAAEAEPEVEKRRSLASQYESFTDQQFQLGKQQLDAMDERWAKCMANEGFADMQSPGDHFPLIYQKIDLWEAGDIEHAEALEFDREIGLAGFNCSAEIEDTRGDFKDDIADKFAQEVDLDLEGLSG